LADTLHPILGADFFSKENILIDCRNSLLIHQHQTNRGDPLPQESTTPSQQETQLAVNHITPSEGILDTIRNDFPNLITKSTTIKPSSEAIHYIPTHPCTPKHSRSRPLPLTKRDAVEKEFIDLENAGIIRRSCSAWASPIHVVTKKDGSFRPCGDYRALNTETIHDAYPMPLIKDLITRFAGSTIFSTIDLSKAYHQFPVNPIDIPKTAVTTPFGNFEYLYMPFGLRNAAQTLQRFMDSILRDQRFSFAYLDDIIIASPDIATHNTHLLKILRILNQNNLQINLDKCTFFQTRVRFLGHILTSSGCEPFPERLDVIRNFPRPNTVTQLRSFLGTVNFCHRFIPNSSNLSAPLSTLNKGNKNSTIIWTDEALTAFAEVKTALSNIKTLFYPREDLHFTLTTDASNIAAGAVLHQICNNAPQPIEFFSRKFSTPETKYSTFDKELLAMYLAVKHFSHFLEGRKFTIFTDHKPLLHYLTLKNPSPRVLRQTTFLSSFDIDIKHVAGKDNIVADCLSRGIISSITTIPLFTNQLLRTTPPSESDLNRFKTSLKIIDGVHYDTFYQGILRPILHESLRKEAFHATHNLHHPGAKSTYNILRQKVTWYSMFKDIKSWTAECNGCQQHKISRHLKPPITHFPTGSRFDILHIDLVGPLPPDDGFSYILTMIDRKTRWFEAVPVHDISAATVSRSLVNTWFSRYGLPTTIITDQGRQFESDLFNHLTHTLGIKHLRTSPYHPQTNGLVERLHRTMKTSLRILATTHSWTKALPFVLLGWHNTPNRPSGTSPSQLLFGSNTFMPCEIIESHTDCSLPEINATRNHFLNLDTNPSFTNSTTYKPFMPKSLYNATHAWLRATDSSNLKPRYKGPFKIINLTTNTAILEIDSGHVTINISRLKPAFGIHVTDDTNKSTQLHPDTIPEISEDNLEQLSLPTAQPPPTAKDRSRRPPAYLENYHLE